MDFQPLVRALGRESLLLVASSDELADAVYQSAKERAADNDAYLYHKRPTPISYSRPLTTSPAQVLHELGVATTFLTASPLAQVARHWAHVRYCATLTNNGGRLALSRYAEDVVYHHKVTQSEQLGVGLALVAAKAVLRAAHPGWEFRAVDAEVALKAGFVEGLGTVQQAGRARKRPDYFLVGHNITGRRSGFKIFILECKGTHKGQAFAIDQLATASVQVQTVEVAGRTPPSLIVASCLARSGITAYVLDPPGEDDLWSGPTRELDELLSEAPDDQHWRPAPPTPEQAVHQPGELEAGHSQPTRASASGTDVDGGETELQPGAPEIFHIPEQRRGWFLQVLTRAAALSALLFAGDSAAAAGYATPRQRGQEYPSGQQPLMEIDPPWELNTATSIRLPNGLRLEGTRYRTPLPDGKVLEVFRGIERRLHGLLAAGEIGRYLRAAPALYTRWAPASRDLADGVLSIGRDGTALVLRVTSQRG